jgi:peptidyl-prolyl cis-trans isomerase SurA
MNKLKTLFLLVFIFCAIISKSQDTLIVDQVIATVGSKIILDSDIQVQYLQMKARGSVGDNPKCEIFEEQLFQKLLLNQAEIDSVEVSELEVESELDSRIDVFIEQMGSIEALETYFNKSVFEIKEQFKEIIEEQLLSQRVQYSITENIKVTPADVRNFYNSMPEDSLPIVDTKYEIQLIRIYPEFTDEELQIPIEKLESYREKIISGEKKFETLATYYSKDTYSATNGGELGFMGRGELDPEFAAVAFSLDVDEVSDVVKSSFGYHIIQLIERKGEKINCRHILLTPIPSGESKLKAKNKLDSIKNMIAIDSLTFEEAATKFSEDEDSNKNSGLMINPYSGDSKFEEANISVSIKYVLNKMEIGDISKPVESVDDAGVTCYEMYKLKTKTVPHIANMDQDYQEIMNLALNFKQQEIINEWIKEKQKAVYIHIDDEYKTCDFQFSGWLK